MSCFCYFIEWLLMLHIFVFFIIFSQRLLWQHLAGSVLLVPLQSVFFCRIWREFVLVPFQSASIDAAFWREVCFWFLLIQRLFLPHLAGSCLLVPIQSFFLMSAQSVSPERLPKTPHGNRLLAKITKGKCMEIDSRVGKTSFLAIVG